MNFLLKISRVIDTITEWTGGIANIIVLITIAIGFYNVFVRYIGRFIGIRLSSNVYIELQWYLYSMIFFLGFAYILKHGVNVRVDFLYANWRPETQAWVDLIGTILVLIPFCIIGIYATYGPVMTSWGRLPNGSWGTWEVSPDPDGLPRAPIKTMIIVAFVLLLMQSISQIIKYIAILTGHKEVVEVIKADTEEFVA